MDTNNTGDQSWRKRFEADLLDFRHRQHALFGGIDELMLVRYEEGSLSDEDRDKVERALAKHPALRECLNETRDFDEVPVKPFIRKRRFRIPQWAPMAAAILVAIAVLVFARRQQPPDPPNPKNPPETVKNGNPSPPAPDRHPNPQVPRPQRRDNPPDEVIVKQPINSPPPNAHSDEGRADLLAKIAPLLGKPIDVKSEDIKSHRQAALAYRAEHPQDTPGDIARFIVDAEATPDHEFLYAETKAKEALRSRDAADIRKLRLAIIDLQSREETAERALRSQDFAALMALPRTGDPAAHAEEMKAEARMLAAQLPPSDRNSPRLLCVLPEPLLKRAVRLYGDVQALALKQEGPLDPEFVDFLTRTRRPIAEDTLGMIIPLYLYPDAANSARWNQILALGGQGVRVKAVISPNLDDVQAADIPAYRALIVNAKQRGIEVLGKVSFSAQKVTAEEQIDLYINQHNGDLLNGLFFTEFRGGVDYAKLYAKVRDLRPDWRIVSGPTGPVDERYFTEAKPNIICPMGPAVPQTHGWEGKYSPTSFAAIVDNVADPGQVPGLIQKAAANHIGWVYLGGENLVTNPPAYLNGELAEILKINQAILGGQRQDTGTAAKKATTKKSAPKKK